METKDKIVRRDARGRWLPGSLVNPAGRPKKTGRHISNLIKAAFDEKVDVIIGRASLFLLGGLRWATHWMKTAML